MSEDTDGGLKLLLLTCFFRYLYTFLKESVKTNAESDICNLRFSLRYSLLLKYYTRLKKPRGAICEIAALLMESRDACVISHQWTSNSGPGGHCDTSVRRGFRSGWKLPLSICGPCTKEFWSHGVEAESWQSNTSTLSHTYRYTFNLFILNSLCLFVFLSCSLTLTHVSTDPQVMTSHLQQLRTKRWRVSQGGRMAVLFCWCREFESSPSAPKGRQYTFRSLMHQLSIQEAWNKYPWAVNYHFSILR